jgi:hypothetical protein
MSLLDQVTNEYTVEVDLLGDALDPEKITAIMGVKPSESAKAGEPRKHNHGALHDHGFWTYEAVTEGDISECRDYQLQCLADMIHPHLDQLRGAGVERIYFYYTLCSHTGLMNIHFKTETLAWISARGAYLYISCFDCFNPNDPMWKENASLSEEEASS